MGQWMSWGASGSQSAQAAASPYPAASWLFIGDSLTAGSGGVTPWPVKFATRIPRNTAIKNVAVGGTTAAQIRSQWLTNNTPAPNRVFVLGGINSIVADLTGAATYASLQSIYASAASMGVSVVAMQTLPFGDASSWTSGRQAELDNLHALIAADPNINTLIDLYSLMGEPGTPTALATIYSISDGVHPNEAGTTFMANTIATALGI